MARLTANPEAEASVAFDVLQPQVAQMRVAAITEKESKSTPGNKLWEVKLEFVNPHDVLKQDGSPAKNPGTLIDSSLVVHPPEKQGKVKGFVLSCGKEWSGDIDSEDLIGCECTIKTSVEEYPQGSGDFKTRVSRYIFAKD